VRERGYLDSSFRESNLQTIKGNQAMIRSTLLVLLIVAPPIITAGVMRTRERPRRFFEVEAGRLYRGGFPTGDQIRRMHRDLRIRTVISLTSDEDRPRDRDLEKAIGELHLRHLRFAMSGDGTGELATLDEAADALAAEEDGPIFFHCAAGKQRSSAALGAYWMKHKGKSLDEALKDLSREYGLDAEGEDQALAEQLKKYAQYLRERSGQTVEEADDSAGE